jgi:hypothetical protein
METGFMRDPHQSNQDHQNKPAGSPPLFFYLHSSRTPGQTIRYGLCPLPLAPGSQVGRQAGQDPGRCSSSSDRPQILTRSTGKASPWQPPGGRRYPAGCRRRASAGRDRAPYSVPGPHSSHPAGNFRRAAEIHQPAASLRLAVAPGTYQVLTRYIINQRMPAVFFPFAFTPLPPACGWRLRACQVQRSRS